MLKNAKDTQTSVEAVSEECPRLQGLPSLAQKGSYRAKLGLPSLSPERKFGELPSYHLYFPPSPHEFWQRFDISISYATLNIYRMGTKNSPNSNLNSDTYYRIRYRKYVSSQVHYMLITNRLTDCCCA
jgi:hypothetical protein